MSKITEEQLPTKVAGDILTAEEFNILKKAINTAVFSDGGQDSVQEILKGLKFSVENGTVVTLSDFLNFTNDSEDNNFSVTFSSGGLSISNTFYSIYINPGGITIDDLIANTGFYLSSSSITLNNGDDSISISHGSGISLNNFLGSINLNPSQLRMSSEGNSKVVHLTPNQLTFQESNQKQIILMPSPFVQEAEAYVFIPPQTGMLALLDSHAFSANLVCDGEQDVFLIDYKTELTNTYFSEEATCGNAFVQLNTFDKYKSDIIGDNIVITFETAPLEGTIKAEILLKNIVKDE